MASGWIECKVRGNHAIQGSWVGKTRNMYRFCRKKYNYSLLSPKTLNLLQPYLLQDTLAEGKHWFISPIILRTVREMFLQFDWFRAVVFQLNLKYLHVKITNLLCVVV